MEKNDLVRALQEIGVKKGHILYVASDSTDIIFNAIRSSKPASVSREETVRSLMGLILDALIETVGEEGTLLIPVFNWDFCKGIPFDYNKTKSQVGYLGNAALKQKDFKRTAHPIYSFAVWGRDKEYLTSLANVDSWGGDSPFAFIQHQYDRANFLNVGIHNKGEGFSFLHYVEQAVGVDFRYHKKFTGEYIDENGERTVRTYSMFVRDTNRKIITVCGEDFLKKHGIIKIKDDSGITLKFVNIRDAYKVFWNELTLNGGKDVIFPVE